MGMINIFKSLFTLIYAVPLINHSNIQKNIGPAA